MYSVFSAKYYFKKQSPLPTRGRRPLPFERLCPCAVQQSGSDVSCLESVLAPAGHTSHPRELDEIGLVRTPNVCV